MEFDVDAFRALVLQRGKVVCTASYDGGAPGYSGSAGVVRFGGAFFAYDDDGGFGGPHQTLGDALGDEHLAFGEVDVTVQVTGMSAARYAALVQLDAPEGHEIEINGKTWVLGEDGTLAPAEPPKKRKAAPRKKGKG